MKKKDKKDEKKLTLAKETVRALETSDLELAAGGRARVITSYASGVSPCY